MKQSTKSFVIICVCLIVCTVARARAETEPDYASQLRHIKPLEPTDAIESFELLPGFSAELVASEPLISSPVAMAFDAMGRLYVVEMRDYSEHDKARLGRIRLLSDSDGDGRYDQSTIFAENLSWPTAIICWEGGVFVGAAPDILYLKDADGDGKAEIQKPVFTGFGRSNVQGLMNTFLWGLDNRIHGATSSSGGQVRLASTPDAPPINLNGRDFAFDPRTLEIQPVTGGAQHGAAFDDWGRRFVCSNSDHLQMVMYEDRYISRHSAALVPPSRLSIAADGPQAEVFRLSPVEPWRTARTQLRLAGKAPGPIEGGGRASGYFTSATGVTLYRGDAWPTVMRGQVFVADVGSNLIHRKRLEPNGATMIGLRIDTGREFLASRDIGFRPVQLANAPDGTLWVVDMYREVIEHPASLPPIIKKHLDLDRGRDRGRIYRIVAEGGSQRPLPQLDRLSSAGLVDLLSHANAWHRETAARLLYERQDQAAVAPLQNQLAGTDPLGRLHALYTLRGMKSLTSDRVLQALRDPHPRLREHAARLAEDFKAVPAVLRELPELAFDDDIRVRFQAALSLSQCNHADPLEPLKNILSRDADDRWVRFAVLNALGDDGVRLLTAVLTDDRLAEDNPELLREIAASIPKNKITDAIGAIQAHPRWALAVFQGLAERHGSTQLRLTLEADAIGLELFTKTQSEAQRIAAETQSPVSLRVLATKFLGYSDPVQALPPLASLLHTSQPIPVQLASIAALDGINDPAVVSLLLESMTRSEPTIRAALLDAMLTRPARAAALLDAIESKRFPLAELQGHHRARLKSYPDSTVRRRAKELLSNTGSRTEIVEKYTRQLNSLRGDSARGKQVFIQSCSACHKHDNLGVEIGPNLAAFSHRGTEAFVLNVLDPNREVNPQYVNYIVTTNDGRVMAGMIVAQSDQSLTLSTSGTIHTLDRSRITSVQSTGLSLMPEGLEAAISPQAMADLFTYLTPLPRSPNHEP